MFRQQCDVFIYSCMPSAVLAARYNEVKVDSIIVNKRLHKNKLFYIIDMINYFYVLVVFPCLILFYLGYDYVF